MSNLSGSGRVRGWKFETPIDRAAVPAELLERVPGRHVVTAIPVGSGQRIRPARFPA